MARFTSILDRLGGGNSNVVSLLVEGRKVPMGSGLFNPSRMDTGILVEQLTAPPVKHKKKKEPKKHQRKEVRSKSVEVPKTVGTSEYNPRYTSWIKKAKKINIEGEGIHFNKKKD